MKFEDTKLLDHPAVKASFEICSTFLSGSPDESDAKALRLSIATAEILTQHTASPDPQLVASVLLMSPLEKLAGLPPANAAFAGLAFRKSFATHCQTPGDDNIASAAVQTAQVNLDIIKGGGPKDPTTHDGQNVVKVILAGVIARTSEKAQELNTLPEEMQARLRQKIEQSDIPAPLVNYIKAMEAHEPRLTQALQDTFKKLKKEDGATPQQPKSTPPKP